MDPGNRYIEYQALVSPFHSHMLQSSQCVVHNGVFFGSSQSLAMHQQLQLHRRLNDGLHECMTASQEEIWFRGIVASHATGINPELTHKLKYGHKTLDLQEALSLTMVSDKSNKNYTWASKSNLKFAVGSFNTHTRQLTAASHSHQSLPSSDIACELR